MDSAAFSPDGQRVVTASKDQTVKVWDAASGALIWTLQDPASPGASHTDEVFSAGYSPDGRFIVTASKDETAKVWDAHDGQWLRTLQGHQGAVYSAVFSPDSQTIATASADNTVILWGTTTGQPVRTLRGHTAAVYSVVYNHDGTKILTASADYTLKVWDAGDGQELQTLVAWRQRPIRTAVFSPDETWILSAGDDNAPQVYSAGITELLHAAACRTHRLLTPEERGLYLPWEGTPVPGNASSPPAAVGLTLVCPAPVVPTPLAWSLPSPLPALPPISAAPPITFQKGMNYPTYSRRLFSGRDSDRALADLRRTGANAVAIVVTQYQDTAAALTIAPDTLEDRTAPDTDVVHAIDQAHQLGLSVMLKPHLDLGNNDPRSTIGSAFTTDAQWQAWFRAYETFIVHYADLAQRQGVELLCIGIQLEGTSPHEREWRALIATIRQHFHGKLTYAGNTLIQAPAAGATAWVSGEVTQIAWWDALDYIGVEAFGALLPAEAGAQGAIRDQLAALGRHFDRPLLLTGVGYQSCGAATGAPCAGVDSGCPGGRL